MNWAHLKTFVWLRWRLAVNQTRRSGPGGAVVSAIVTVLMTAGGGVTLIVGFLVGFLALRTGPSRAVMVVWDGAIVGFVFFWLVGLMSELQRSDALSLDRFLHLPVSPTGAFLINYLGSSVSLSLVLMLPAMTGLSAGLVLSRGPGMLVAVSAGGGVLPDDDRRDVPVPRVAGQHDGKPEAPADHHGGRAGPCSSCCSNSPTCGSTWAPARGSGAKRERSVIRTLDKDLAAGRITREEYSTRRPASPARDSDDGYETARMVNMIVPPGWLAYGAEAAADGRVWPAWAGVLGMGLIGAVSLRRAYGTTLRLYRGDFDSGRRAAAVGNPRCVAPAGPSPRVSPPRWWNARLPWMSERVSSVAVTGFRSWMRASEMKMALFTPVMMLVVFARMFAGGSGTAPELVRPLTTSGLAGLVLILGMVGPVGNQFGYDRAGFLAFVLSPAPRRDVLMGKNLSLLPFALVTMVVMVGLSQWFNPMRLDHLVALLFQLVSMYLLFCLAGNLLSIIGPIALKPGSGMPAGHQGIRSFAPLLFMVVVPMLLGLTLIPLGIEALLSVMNWFAWFPAYLVFGAVQAVVMIWLYRRVLDWEGGLLQRREPQILDIVGSRIE